METLCGDQSCRTHLTHLSFSVLQFVGVCFRAALGPGKARAPALPGACAVGKGHELHAGAESKAKPPLHKAHLHRCQCSVPGQCTPTQGGEAAGRLGEALGWSGGWHSGVYRSCSLSRATATPLSRVSECKGPVSQIHQEKATEQKKWQPAVCLWSLYTPCPGHSTGSCPSKAQSTMRCSAPSSPSPGCC